MKRKTKRPQKPLPHPSPVAGGDEIGALAVASARALGLTLDPAWLIGVAFNLQLILRHAALVDEFPLPDGVEPAPVFRA